MSKRAKRRRFTVEQKSKVVVEHLQDKKPVSAICEELGIHPNQYYEWQRHALGNLGSVFERDTKKLKQKHSDEVSQFEDKLAKKDEVIVELLSEHIALKKSLGES